MLVAAHRRSGIIAHRFLESPESPERRIGRWNEPQSTCDALSPERFFAALGETEQGRESQQAIDAQGLDPTGWAMLVPPDGVGPRLLFQRAPKTTTAAIPIHLDLEVEDREAEVPRLCELGATVVETKSRKIGSFTETWTVMRDPEANGFCVR